MGAAASMPAVRAGAWEAGISHSQRVTRLYRASLRTSRDWIHDYDLWCQDAAKIQTRFRSNKDKSLTEGRFLAEKGMAELLEKRHPEPYIPIYIEGASSYQRNVPPPPEVSVSTRGSQCDPIASNRDARSCGSHHTNLCDCDDFAIHVIALSSNQS